MTENGAGSEPDWDETEPSRSGVFRWLRNHFGSATPSVLLVEELFAPSRHQARMEIEAQPRVSLSAPAPTDPAEPRAAGITGQR
jgi:hypothetical protein